MAGPSAFFFQGDGHVPVVERDIGGKAQFEAFVYDPVVEGDAFFIYASHAFGEDTRPGQRKAEDGEAEGFYQEDVIFIAVVEIAGDGGPAAAFYLALAAGEGIPDGGSFAVTVPCAFVLYGGHRHAPF